MYSFMLICVAASHCDSGAVQCGSSDILLWSPEDDALCLRAQVRQTAADVTLLFTILVHNGVVHQRCLYVASNLSHKQLS
jgi:hypothetical protein